jgi:two-component system, NarL family, response regulator LiaR
MSTSVREAKRVVLCDDHEIVREAIKSRMANSNIVEIVGEASNGRDVVDAVKQLEPDVLIIDVEMPKRDGIEATKEVLKVRPRTKVIIFTAHAQPDLLALALRAGASGYVLKSAPAEDIAKAVKAVTGGGTFLGGDFAGGKPSEVEKLLELSPRERQILELLAEGLRVKEIADRLQLSPATVHTHVRNAIAKLEVDTRTEAVALAVRFSYLGAGGGSLQELLLLIQRQRAAVDAVALAALVSGAVVEDVPEVGVAVFADDLRTAHEEAVVGPQLDVLEVGRLGEAGPAGARVELGVGGEELGAATDAAVHPLRLLVDVGAGEGPLGARLAGHLVLLRGELLAPLLLALLNFRCQFVSFLSMKRVRLG